MQTEDNNTPITQVQLLTTVEVLLRTLNLCPVGREQQTAEAIVSAGLEKAAVVEHTDWKRLSQSRSVGPNV